MTRPIPVVAWLCTLWLAACAAPPPAENPTTIDARAYGRAFDASVETLRDRGFRVDRQDFRFGTVSSKPDPSPTILEPWRGDNRSLGLAAWSTASDLRRVVTVTLDPQPEGMDRSTYELGVVVELQRKQQPLRRLDGRSSREQFAAMSEVPEEWAQRGMTATSWEPVGRDMEMEQLLLREIVERLRVGE